MSDRIELQFRDTYSYEEGSEYHRVDLFDAVADYIIHYEDGRDLYDRWLSKGDTTITIVKGIHQTEDDRRPHFTIRVGSKAFHAYIDKEPTKYTVIGMYGKTAYNISKPSVFSVTEMFSSRSYLSKGRYFKRKTLKKKARARTKAQFRPSILPLLDVENEYP